MNFTGYWVAKPRTKNPEIIVKLEDAANSPMVYEVILKPRSQGAITAKYSR
jgi:hypothetical protein